MKSEKLIMVVEREILFGNNVFEGFKHQTEVDYESRILNNFKYMNRGLAEENPTHKQPVGYAMIVNPRVLGYINDDSNDVGRVHFGVLYVVETDSRIVRPKDPEIDNGKLRTIEELEIICSSSDFTVEEWSRISLEPLRQYIQTSR